MVHSVELLFDPDTESAIRGLWQRLSDAGLRSPAATSRPHITMVVADTIGAEVDSPLAALREHFPFRALIAAPMVFGRSPFILVRAVVPSTELLNVHADALRMCLPYSRPGAAPNTLTGHWAPHVTLARRVQAAQLDRALTIRAVSREFSAAIVGLRRWDGEKRVEHLIS